MKQQYNRGPGFLGDHYIIDVAVGHGYVLDDESVKWYNYGGSPDDEDWSDYDLGVGAVAESAAAFLRDRGHVVTEEENE